MSATSVSLASYAFRRQRFRSLGELRNCPAGATDFGGDFERSLHSTQEVVQLCSVPGTSASDRGTSGGGLESWCRGRSGHGLCSAGQVCQGAPDYLRLPCFRATMRRVWGPPQPAMALLATRSFRRWPPALTLESEGGLALTVCRDGDEVAGPEPAWPSSAREWGPATAAALMGAAMTMMQALGHASVTLYRRTRGGGRTGPAGASRSARQACHWDDLRRGVCREARARAWGASELEPAAEGGQRPQSGPSPRPRPSAAPRAPARPSPRRAHAPPRRAARAPHAARRRLIRAKSARRHMRGHAQPSAHARAARRFHGHPTGPPRARS